MTSERKSVGPTLSVVIAYFWTANEVNAPFIFEVLGTLTSLPVQFGGPPRKTLAPVALLSPDRNRPEASGAVPSRSRTSA